MHQVTIRTARDDELDELIPILLGAEPSEHALRWSLAHMIDVVYVLWDGDQKTGAATVRWRDEPAEIVELAIATGAQRHGLGRIFVQWIVAEALRRGVKKLEVGTSNASIGNMRFYQRCGFRMDHIRRDYFWYYREPRSEDGITIRDLLVFSMELDKNRPGTNSDQLNPGSY